MPEKKKMGRPTDAVKNHDIRVRVTEETYRKLEAYRERKGLNRAEAVRDAIHRLPED